MSVYNTVNTGHMLVTDLASSVGLLQIVSQKSEPHLCSLAWIRSGWHGFFALSPAAESGRFLTNKITKGGQRWQTCLTIILEPGGRKLQCGKQVIMTSSPDTSQSPQLATDDAPSSTLAIETHNLRKHFGQRKAVDGLTISIPAGTIAGFVGPN